MQHIYLYETRKVWDSQSVLNCIICLEMVVELRHHPKRQNDSIYFPNHFSVITFKFERNRSSLHNVIIDQGAIFYKGGWSGVS